MGNYCKCPENKVSSHHEVIVSSNQNTQLINELKYNSLSPIIKIQKYFRMYLFKANTSVSKFSSTETKVSLIKRKTTSIKATFIDELYKNYPFLSNGNNLIHIDAYYIGIGEYTGEINDITKERSGRGIQIRSDKSIYLGYWKNDKPNGKGKLIYHKGDYYEGDFVDGKIEGFGHYINEINGISYIGTWKNELQDGNGTEKWDNDTEYEGQYREGKK